jgi:hypothetical protein
MHIGLGLKSSTAPDNPSLIVVRSMDKVYLLNTAHSVHSNILGELRATSGELDTLLIGLWRLPESESQITSMLDFLAADLGEHK